MESGRKREETTQYNVHHRLENWGWGGGGVLKGGTFQVGSAQREAVGDGTTLGNLGFVSGVLIRPCHRGHAP
jgi:hypothetical protein